MYLPLSIHLQRFAYDAVIENTMATVFLTFPKALKTEMLRVIPLVITLYPKMLTIQETLRMSFSSQPSDI